MTNVGVVRLGFRSNLGDNIEVLVANNKRSVPGSEKVQDVGPMSQEQARSGGGKGYQKGGAVHCSETAGRELQSHILGGILGARMLCGMCAHETECFVLRSIENSQIQCNIAIEKA